jgi:hypothetical protein
MNILLTILTILAGLITLLLIIGLFSKKGYTVEREITINKPKREVFDYIKFLKNQDYYSKWVMVDPHMKKELKGQDGTDGFIYAWDGNNKAGAGEQEIKKITEGERIDMEVRFKRPFKGVATTYMATGIIPTDAPMAIGSNQDQTKVKWFFGSQLNYPMNLMLLFMNMDKMLGKDIETSLANLKGNLEK